MELVEAMEMLSRIALMDEPQEELAELFAEQGIGDALADAGELFRSVQQHLESLYSAGILLERKGLLPGIKGMMATVGEAAVKLDGLVKAAYGAEAHEVTRLQEYRDLTRFYLDRIVKELEGSATRKQLAAALEEPLVRRASSAPDHRTGLTDMERVKADTDYELFFMVREDSTPYVGRDLVENLKITVDFGDYVGDDPLVQVQLWLDGALRHKAAAMFKAVRPHLEGEWAHLEPNLIYATMAVCLAANPHNLLRNLPARPCSDYFHDFQTFLRETESKAPLADGLRKAFFLEGRINDRMPGILLDLIDRGHALQEEPTPGSWLEADYGALGRLLALHPNGPLFKVLDLLRESREARFEPLMQGNVPSRLFALDQTLCIRLPTPTRQRGVESAVVCEEYLAFLGALDRADESQLLINLQDRESWKEEARVEALETIDSDALTLVHLSRDSLFYHQLAPFHDEEEASAFFTLLHEQVAISERIDADRLIREIHEDHFERRPILSRLERLDFIEIYHARIVLELVETLEPDSVAFCCKDGVDSSMALAAGVYLAAGGEDRELLRNMLFLPPLLLREREMHPSRFKRLANLEKRLNTSRGDSSGRAQS